MINFFIRRPATTIMLIAFLTLMGLVSFFNLNIERQPKVEFPLVSIFVEYPGATPEDIELNVIKEIEDAVVEVSEIKKITSKALPGQASTTVEFLLESDINIKLMEVKDKVDAIIKKLPKEVEKPTIQKVDVLKSSVADILLDSSKHDLKQLWDYADKKLKPMLTSIEGIASVEIIGGQEQQIDIKLDTNLMKQKFISISEVLNAINSYNINMPSGSVEIENTEISVRFYSEFDNLDKIRNMEITTVEGSVFKLEDIAKVENSYKENGSQAFYNGKEVLFLSLVKISDGNAVKIARQLDKKLPEIEKLLQDGMKIEVVNNTTDFVIEDTINTIVNIIIGVILTILILLVFSGQVYSTLIITLIVPISLIATMFLMDISGFTINSMTLLAFATVLGTLIDNSIVIIESFMLHLKKGTPRLQAAIEGTKEVIGVVFAGSGTNLAVFIPIAFMGGIAGQFMRQFGMTVVYATIISIVVSFSLTPMLMYLLVGKEKKGKVKNKESLPDKIHRVLVSGYKGIFAFTFRHRVFTTVASLIIFFLSIFSIKYIENEFIPSSDVNRVYISFDAPIGATDEFIMTKLLETESILGDFKEIKNYVSKINHSNVVDAEILLNLTDRKTRKISDIELIDQIMPKLKDITDVDFEVKREGSGPKGADMTIEVYGDDYHKINQYSKQIQGIMEELGVYRSISSNYKMDNYEYKFIPNQEKLNLYGVSNSEVALAIRTSIQGNDNNVFKQNKNNYDIKVSLIDKYIDTENVFDNIYVKSVKGLIAVKNLGDIYNEPSIPEIVRKDRIPTIEITAFIAKGKLGGVQKMTAQAVAEKVKFEDGYGISFAGMSEFSGEASKEIGKAFILAVILTYIVLAAIMNSFIHPFTISISIIMSFGGVFSLLFFTGFAINLPAMLAFIMLIGLAVNVSILLLEKAVENVKEGMGVAEALWESIEERLIMMLITSVSIIFATLPQAWSADQGIAAMGIVIIGGIAGSIFFSLIFIPIVFYYIEIGRQKFMKLLK